MRHRFTSKSALHCLLSSAFWVFLASTASAADDKPRCVLHLTDNGFVPGELRGSDDLKAIHWRSPLFASTLDFPLNAVKAVHYEMVGQPPAPHGEFCFELVDDDFLYGDLLELTDDDVILASARLGRIRLRRDRVRRLYRYAGADSIYLGPSGFIGWKDKATTREWRDDGGQLQTDKPGASLFGDLGLPDKATISFELSWQDKPDFVIALGVDERDAAAPRGVHFEVWDDDLVAVVESAREADVTSIQKVGSGPGRVRIQAHLDQSQGRLILLSSGGQPVATLNARSKKPVIGSGLRLTNGKGDVRLEYLRIARWNGQPPRDAQEDQQRIHRKDGTIAYGRVSAYDPKAKQFTLQEGATKTVVSQDAVAELFLATPPPVAKPPANPPASKPPTKSTSSPFKITDELIEDYVIKDGEIRGLLSTISGVKERLTKLRAIAAAPDALPENKETAAAVKKLEQQIEQRKVQLRPVIRQKLEAIRDMKPDEPEILGDKGRPQPSAVDKPSPAPLTGPSDGTVRCSLRDGQRFSGTLSRIENAHLTLTAPNAREPLRVPLVELRSLIMPRRDQPPARFSGGKSGRLEMDGLSLKGCLVGGGETPEASCLVWRPEIGLNASPLVRGPSGRVVYREAPEAPKAGVAQPRTAMGQVFVQQAGGVVVRPVMVMGNVRGTAQSAPKEPQSTLPGSGKPALHLRSGDTIPCEVISMDDKGVTLKTPISATTFVPNEKIKSIELIAMWGSTQVDDTKRDRLLTLPRLQKDAPPTHLICSKNGDFLRGRVLEMNEAQMKVEVRLENKMIPRDRVAQIIWLHADELTGKPAVASPGELGQKTRVQSLRQNGDRLTFFADKADLEQISGKSEVLGPCQVALAEVDQLLFGTFIEQSAAMLAYHLWKLHHATEPKFVQAGEGDAANGGVAGIDSPLVGQPAFAFKLDMLDGAKFDLAEHKGHVVVLDFWATWCGPCMESMPMVDEVVRSFAGQQVELVTVNLEEQADRIKSTLGRQKWKVAVALDRDGVAAAKYAVTAIPQTVVVDREGKIVRLFIGGGKNAAEALRTALQELTDTKPPATTATPPK